MNEKTGKIEEIVANVLVQETKYDAPLMQNIPLEDFFYEPGAKDVVTSVYCAHRYWEPLYTLMEKQNNGIYRNVDKIGTVGGGGTKSPTSFERVASIGLQSDANIHKDEIEIYEYDTDDWKVVVTGSGIVLSCEENPYWHREKPFTRWICTPVPNEFYGIGLAEMCESLQHELNTTRNQRIDNVSYVLNRMFKIAKTADIDPEQLVSRPNGYIEVDTMDDIEVIEVPDVTASAYKEEEIIKNDMDVVTGVHNYDRGASTERRETATTATIMSQGSNERFNLQVNLIEFGGFADSGRQIAELNRQYVDRTITFSIVNDMTQTEGELQSESVAPEDLDIDFDIMVSGSAVDPIANKETRQNQLIQLLNVVQQNPNVNITSLIKEILEQFDINNINEILQPPMPQPQALPEEQIAMGGNV
jgi:hypothetical protein